MNEEKYEEQKENDSKQSIEESIIKIQSFLSKLFIKKKQFFIFNGIVAILSIIILLFLIKPFFTSTVSILPEYGGQSMMLGGLSNLASMAGINVGEAAPTEIYEHILKSEKVIAAAVYSNYQTEEFADSVNLIEYFEIETTDEEMPIEWQNREIFLELYKKLVESKINTDVDRITKILNVSVTMPEPRLSAEVANNLVHGLNNYITIDRQSYAREQSEYLYNRLKEVKDTLTYFEEELKEFTEKNRVISNSPLLTLEQNRLVRQVEISKSVYIELITQYEIVKLEEVKDAPVINIMEKADPPIKKSGPNRKLILVAIMFFSIILSSAYFIMGDEFKKYYTMIKSNR